MVLYAGNATGATSFFGASGVAQYWTRTKYWQIGSFIGSALIRNCDVERFMGAIVVLNSRRLPTAVTATVAIGASASTVDPLGATQDVIIAGNDLRFVKGARAWSMATTLNANAGATALGTTYDVGNRQVFANNVVEATGTSNPLFATLGDSAGVSYVSTQIIVEGNTLVGDRTNYFYDIAPAANVAATDAASSIAQLNRVANNVFDQHSIKTDFYNDPVIQAQRTAAGDPRTHGYRPNAIRSWPALYGVGFVDNVILRGNQNLEFLHEFEGIGTPNYTVETGAPADPRFTLDKSGTDVGGFIVPGTGGGNYKPLAGSPMVGHSRAANVDRDMAGVPRRYRSPPARSRTTSPLPCSPPAR